MENIKGKSSSIIRVDYNIVKTKLNEILLKQGFSETRAFELAKIFSDNSLFGKDSHGVNRFKPFINSVREGLVKIDSVPVKTLGNNAIEQWDGSYGPGPLNAKFCTGRAIELASEYGIGCVALKNTNHWMRGGTYGWQAAEAGYILICWTNAIPTMPPWGGTEPKLGNNPLVIAVPNKEEHVVLDIAMSQYSYGKLEKLIQSNDKTDYFAGYDEKGNLTKDPGSVMKTKRALPIGLWKGSGLALMLDLLAALLSGGRSTVDIGKEKAESGVSQIFIALKPVTGINEENIKSLVQNVLDDIHSTTGKEKDNLLYPGELSRKLRDENLKQGVPVDKRVWEEISEM